MPGAKNANCCTLALDVTYPTSIKSYCEEAVLLSEGSLDILVNNVGRNYGRPIIDIDVFEMRNIFKATIQPSHYWYH